MRISKAIELYRKGIYESINNMGEFSMIKCGDGCSCVRGMKFNRITLDGTILYADSYKFRLSMDLANQLESEFMPVIQPERVNQTWEQRNCKS